MIYQQRKPHPALTPYIDAFWTAKVEGKEWVTEKILPDGCVDIIINFGEEGLTDNGASKIENEKVYLVGTMTHFKITGFNPGTKLLGIRFKPAAFAAFYHFIPLSEIKDLTIEFDPTLTPDFKKLNVSPLPYLNQFFLNRLSLPNHKLFTVIADIENHRGQTSIPALAKRHCTTVRQLERSFKQHIGVTPKEFINFVRYRWVLPAIQHKSPEQSLSDIAFEYGYYDHAHLTNEVKRYTGEPPSQW